MRHLKRIFLLIPFFIISCSTNPYLTNYDSINSYLEGYEKINKKTKYILKASKEPNNKHALKIFNGGGEGIKHIVTVPDYTSYDFFEEKHWKKMYKKYAFETIKRYWKKEDFPNHNFIIEDFKDTPLDIYNLLEQKYNGKINQIIMISEPMYYMNKKYIMFTIERIIFPGVSELGLIIMKKENNKWIRVATMNYNTYS